MSKLIEELTISKEELEAMDKALNELFKKPTKPLTFKPNRRTCFGI